MTDVTPPAPPPAETQTAGAPPPPPPPSPPVDTSGAADVPRETPPEPAPPPDLRPRWVCVTPEGPRTGHAPFHSDDPQYGRAALCPTCGSMSVRRAFEGE